MGLLDKLIQFIDSIGLGKCSLSDSSKVDLKARKQKKGRHRSHVYSLGLPLARIKYCNKMVR